MHRLPTLPSLAPLAGLVRDAVRTSLELFKSMVPIIVAVKVLQELGAIEYLAAPLGPVMALVGLPPDLGLAWATAMLSNIYAGLIVFQALAAQAGPLSVAQVTVLALLMLFAHNLLVEGQVTKRCGVSFLGQNVLRVLGGLGCAWLTHLALNAGGLLSEPAVMLWLPPRPEATLLGWALSEARNLGYIFLVILTLMGLMRLLNALGLTRILEWLLWPFLKIMGISAAAATITVIGMTMGLLYGGGLIIHEARAGHIPPRDVFAAVSLMSLSHALIEDTLLLTLIGASPWGTLGARLLFSLLVVAALSRWAAGRARAEASA